MKKTKSKSKMRERSVDDWHELLNRFLDDKCKFEDDRGKSLGDEFNLIGFHKARSLAFAEVRTFLALLADAQYVPEGWHPEGILEKKA